MPLEERISLNTQIFEFGSFRLDSRERVLLRDGKPTPLPPKAFDLLVVLVERAGRLVTREDLLKEVWSGTFVEEANLSYTVSMLRKALGDDAEPHVFVETVAKRGYRFKVAVERESQTESTIESGRRRTRQWLSAFAALIVMFAFASWLVLQRPAQIPPNPLLRLALPPPAGVTVENAQISPDGQRVAFIGREADVTKPWWGSTTKVWVQRLDSTEAVAFPGSDAWVLPFWAPDSQALAFCVNSGTGQVINKISMSGGPAEPLGPAFCAGGASWGNGGIILFRTGTFEPLYQMKVSGGAPSPVTKVDRSKKDRHFWPQFLPDGRHFLYVVHSDDGMRSGLWVGSLDSLEFKRRLLEDESPAIYGGAGYLLYSRDGNIVARPFDLTRLEFSGPPSTIAYDREYAARYGAPVFVPSSRETPGLAVHRLFGAFGRAIFSASRTGTLAYSLFEPYEYQFTWFDRSGKPLGTAGEPGAFNTFDLSVDGKRVVVARGKNDRFKLWLLDLERRSLTQTTFGDSLDGDPRWEPDGQSIAWTSTQDGVRRILQRGLDGQEREVVSPGVIHDWSPDGRYLVYSWDGRFALPLFGERKKIPLFLGDQPKGADEATFSRDGRLIAFNLAASGRVEVFVQHFPPNGEPKQISIDGGVQPVWRQDGLELYFLGLDGVLYSVTVDVNKFVFGTPRPLFKAPVGTLRSDIEQYATNDGQRFLFLKPLDRRPRPINVVINWPMAIKAQSRP